MPSRYVSSSPLNFLVSNLAFLRDVGKFIDSTVFINSVLAVHSDLVAIYPSCPGPSRNALFSITTKFFVLVINAFIIWFIRGCQKIYINSPKEMSNLTFKNFTLGEKTWCPMEFSCLSRLLQSSTGCGESLVWLSVKLSSCDLCHQMRQSISQ